MKRNFCLAVLGGLMAGMSFPNPWAIGLDWPGSVLVWVCLLPLLAIRETGPSAWRYWRWGLVYGAVYFGLAIEWMSHMRAMGVLGPVAWLILTGYLALYPAAFLAGYRYFLARGIPAWSVAAPWWVILEWLRTYCVSGFPWVALGYAHFRNPWLLSLAPVTGVYGLSWITVLVNVGLYTWIARQLPFLRGQDAEYKTARATVWRWVELGLVLALILGGVLWQQFRLRAEPPVRSFRIAALQGNIDQDQPWDDAYRARTLTTYRDLGMLASAQGVRLVIWPESAFPGIFNWDQSLALEVRDWSRRWRMWQIVGSDTVAGNGQDGFRYYNSALLIGPAGDVLAEYSKIHLVPFGEYIPFKRTLLFFLRKLVERYGAGDFSPGRVRLPLQGQAGGESFSPGVLICFESLFPDYASEVVRRGASFFIVMTNDAWFGASAAPAQHAVFSALRAAENGRDLVRVATTGISCIFDRRGRLLGQIPLQHVGLLPQEVHLYSGFTLYTLLGPWLVWLCLLSVFLEIWFSRNHQHFPRQD
jgi:apolipoprotein N-acyltransferase